jgi:hypothetical protein
VVGDGPVYPNRSWNWWYSLLLLAKVRPWPRLVQTHLWGVSRGWSTTYRPFCSVASGPALKVDPRVRVCQYCSMWLALTVLCQIINLIQNFWFGSYLFNSEIFSICVIYLIKYINDLKMFHYVSGHKDVKQLIRSDRFKAGFFSSLCVFENFDRKGWIFSENFSKVEKNLIYAKAAQVLQYSPNRILSLNYSLFLSPHPFYSSAFFLTGERPVST